MIHSTQAHGVGSTKAAQYLEGWQRERAEFDNFRKRMESEGEQRDLRARSRAAASLLTLADNFQAIVKHVPRELENHGWAQGVLHVARQVEALLQEHGIAPIAQTGVPFNPGLHEVIAQVKDEKIESGTVLEIVQPGYKLGDNVLKPARVKISS